MGGKSTRSFGKAISDRSGFKFPRSEMIIEPGTGYLIHRSESDGGFNQVTHPLARVPDFVDFDDPTPIADARPEQDQTLDLFLTDENGAFVLDDDDLPIDAQLFTNDRRINA